MADTTAIFTTLDDYLLSLADGIVLAQSQLSELGASGMPGRQFQYYLPKVDFELRMHVRVTEDEGLGARYAGTSRSSARARHVVFQPAATDPQSGGGSVTNATTDVLSVISGSFIAVPANEGLPAVVLSAEVTRESATEYTIEVTARNAAGEPNVGLRVEFNLDRDETEEMNPSLGASALASGTALNNGVVTTDSSGVAANTLTLDASQPVGSLLVIVLDAAGRTENLVVEVTS